MKTKLLLPNRYKTVGIFLLILSLTLGILVRFWDFQFGFLTVNFQKAPHDALSKVIDDKINFTDEVALTGIIVALLFIAFAREKNEDEFINRTRLESWQWAVLINYVLLLLTTWAVHGLSYIDVMMYNMLTIPIIFIIRFYSVLYKTRSFTEN
jgi:hypothetical protein